MQDIFRTYEVFIKNSFDFDVKMSFSLSSGDEGLSRVPGIYVCACVCVLLWHLKKNLSEIFYKKYSLYTKILKCINSHLQKPLVTVLEN